MPHASINTAVHKSGAKRRNPGASTDELQRRTRPKEPPAAAENSHIEQKRKNPIAFNGSVGPLMLLLLLARIKDATAMRTFTFIEPVTLCSPYKNSQPQQKYKYNNNKRRLHFYLMLIFFWEEGDKRGRGAGSRREDTSHRWTCICIIYI